MKITLIKRALLLIIALSTSGALYAQTAHPAPFISGRITDKQHQPIPYVNIRLMKAGDTVIIKTTSGKEDGSYLIQLPAAGDYQLRYSALGYVTMTGGAISITDSAAVAAPDAVLSTDLTQLKTVTVTAAKPLVERKDNKTIVNVASSVLAAGNTAFDILERAPGVTVDKDDRITLNGKSGVTVMINDKQTYLSAAQLTALLRSMNGTTIQSLEIITNPSAQYDASGHAGIINIKLKKADQQGTNGTIVLGAGYAKKPQDNVSLSLNHNEGKLNVYGTVTHNDYQRDQHIGLDRVISDYAATPTLFTQDALRKLKYLNNSFKAGLDYNLSSSNTLGLVVSGYGNRRRDVNDNLTKIGPQGGSADSTVHTAGKVEDRYHNIAVNLNDRAILSKRSNVLSADLDYSRVSYHSDASYDSHFFSAAGTELHAPEALTLITPSVVQIRTAKADYNDPLSKTIKLATGAKYSDVNTDNNLQAQSLQNGTFVNDPLRSNHFIYNEKVLAGYVNVSGQFKKTSVQLGLRSEYTHSNGDLTGSSIVKRHYLDFFPSAAISQAINEKNAIDISYSRRIDRPQFDDLNPFVYYLDPFTSATGNAFLRPQYSDNYEFNYSYNRVLNAGLGYSHTTDLITYITVSKGNQSSVVSYNLDAMNTYNANVNASYQINRWWSGNVSGFGFYNRISSDTVLGSSISNNKLSFQLKALQTFTFGRFKGELTGVYNSPLAYSIYTLHKIYYADAGISYGFPNKKASLKLGVNDIFNTRQRYTTTRLLNNNIDFTTKTTSRIANVTYTYNFGNNKVKIRPHEKGTTPEENRTKKNN